MTSCQENSQKPDMKGFAKYTMAVTVMLTGAPAYRIRRFEEAGLCRPCRTGNKQRLYSDEDIELIRRIISLEKDGVNFQGIKMILDMQGIEK